MIIDPSGGTPSNISLIYTSLKRPFSGLQLCRWQYGSIFIRLAIVAESCEIPIKFELIASRSSKVIDLGANRKRICSFLLVINSNVGRFS